MRAARAAIAGFATACLTIFLSELALSQTSVPTCKQGAGAPIDTNGPQWNGWSPGPNDARFQDAAAAGLSTERVKKLKLKWAFNLGDVRVARAQPVIVHDRAEWSRLRA